MSRHLPLAINQARNERKPCAVPGCLKPRHRVGANCYDHNMQRTIYGHPQGRPLRPKEYRTEREEVAQLLQRNLNHPGVIHALQRIGSLLGGRVPVGRSSLARHFQRLTEAGVKPERVLEEVGAVWLWSDRHPGLLPDDIRLDFATAAAVLRLAPLDRTSSWRTGKAYSVAPHTGDRRDLGKLIRSQLGVLLRNFVHTIHREEEQRRAMAQSLALPLDH